MQPDFNSIFNVVRRKIKKYLVKFKKHRKNCECCPVSQLIVRSQRLSWIQVLNCQNCSQCLKCHKSLGLLLGGVLKMFLSLSLSLYLSLLIYLVMSCLLITLNKCLKGHKSLGWLLGGVLKMSLSLSLSLSLYLYLSLSISLVYVMSSHHSEQMSQRSQVSRIALRRCSQNVFVFFIVFVFVFVFVSFFWSFRVFSSLWTNVSKVTSL